MCRPASTPETRVSKLITLANYESESELVKRVKFRDPKSTSIGCSRKKWLENAQKRIDEKEEDKKRKMAARKALTTGIASDNGTPQLTPKENKSGRRRPRSRWVPTVGEAEQPRQRTK